MMQLALIDVDVQVAEELAGDCEGAAGVMWMRGISDLRAGNDELQRSAWSNRRIAGAAKPPFVLWSDVAGAVPESSFLD
jgi:hypothetical protein